MKASAVIKDVRKSAAMTQADLARAAGTSQATVSAYENGRKQPSLETLTRLLEAAGARLVVEPIAEPALETAVRDPAPATPRPRSTPKPEPAPAADPEPKPTPAAPSRPRIVSRKPSVARKQRGA